MPGAVTPQQSQNAIAGATASTGLLNNSQATFASRLAADTGLDPYVVAAWVHLEEPASASSAPNGANNWLNIGDTGSGNFAGNDPAWTDPIKAADQTAAWLKGTPISGYGPPSGGIRAILATAGHGVTSQIAAIQHSGWAASGYPDFGSVYSKISGSNSTVAQLANAAGAPLVAAGDVASAVPDAVASVGSAVGSIATLLTSGQFWLRLGEGIAGLLLLYLGLHALTGNSNSVGDQVKHVKTRFIPV